MTHGSHGHRVGGWFSPTPFKRKYEAKWESSVKDPWICDSSMLIIFTDILKYTIPSGGFMVIYHGTIHQKVTLKF